MWVEDANLDASAHIDWRVAPAPGGNRELADAVADVAAIPLDPDRPLWHMTVVDGLADDRIAADTDMLPIAAESVNVVSCFAVLHHLFDAGTLAREVARVLKKGGLATIDSGRAGTSAEILTGIASTLGLTKLSSAKSCFIDTATQICFRKD